MWTITTVNCAIHESIVVFPVIYRDRLIALFHVILCRKNTVRLVKWMFTAVFVTPDGQHALEGITYSADPK